jgi:hypothetical protein
VNGTQKVLRGMRRRRRLTRRANAFVAVSALAAAGMLAVGSPAAYANVTIDGYTFSPGTAGADGTLAGLQVGQNETVTSPSGVTASILSEVSVDQDLNIHPGFVASFNGTHTATGPISLFAGSEGIEFPDPGSITDCAGQSVTSGPQAGIAPSCGFAVYDVKGTLIAIVPFAVGPTGNPLLAFPAVTQGVSKATNLNNGDSLTMHSNAQGEYHYASTDQIAVEECRPMPTGFDIAQCVGVGSMSGSSGNYSATIAVQGQVGSTVCAKHGGSTNQCSLWTVEVHNDSTGRYWWPLANGVPVSFK